MYKRRLQYARVMFQATIASVTTSHRCKFEQEGSRLIGVVLPRPMCACVCVVMSNSFIL